MSASSVFFPLIPYHPQNDPGATLFRDVEFRFRINSGREIERVYGCSFKVLMERGQEIEAIVGAVCAGMRHDNPKITQDKAEELVQNFIDADGDIVELYNALVKAWNISGVYSKRKLDEPEIEGSANPPMETSQTM